MRSTSWIGCKPKLLAPSSIALISTTKAITTPNTIAESTPGTTRTSTVRIAQVGLGYWGPNLLRNLLSIPGVRLAAVADLDPLRMELPWLDKETQRTADYVSILDR